MKEIKDDRNRWKHTPCSWTGRINIVKMSILSKVIHRFNATPVKLLVAFFADLEQKNLHTLLTRGFLQKLMAVARDLLRKWILKHHQSIMLGNRRCINIALVFKLLRFVWKHNRPWRVKKKKKNRAGVIRFPDFRLYYKAIIK